MVRSVRSFHFAQLQCADVSRDSPAVIGDDALVVAVHRADSVGDDIVKMPGRGVFQTREIKRRRMLEAALRDHAVAVTEPAVTDGAVNLENFAAAFDVAAGE